MPSGKKLKNGHEHHFLYRRYWHMLDRCTKPNAKNYSKYGGRGISVCSEWLADPVSFFEYIKPLWVQARKDFPLDDLDIDRKDPDGNYEPGNVRVLPRIQNSGRRRRAGEAPTNQFSQP